MHTFLPQFRLLVLALLLLAVAPLKGATAQAPAAAPAPPAQAGEQKPAPAPAAPTAKQAPPAAPAVPRSKKLLELLEARRKELDRREELIREEEKNLVQLRGEIEKKVTELLKIKDEIRVDLKAIEERLEQLKVEENKSLASLANIYAKMRPEQAGPLLENMEEKLVVEIFSRMKEKTVSQIMPHLSAKRAVAISKRMSVTR